MGSFATPGFPSLADVDGDGRLTIGDAGAWLQALFFLPGDWLLWLLATRLPSVAAFLEIDAADYGGVLSGFLSALLWLAALLGAALTWQAVRRVDEALTSMVVRLSAEAARRYRVVARMVAFRLNPPAQQARAGVEVTDNLELSQAEILILRLHAALPAGYALTTSELAAKLKIRRAQVPKVLARLERERLIAKALGGHDGETSYTLTGAGRAVLVFRQLIKEGPAGAGPMGTGQAA